MTRIVIATAVALGLAAPLAHAQSSAGALQAVEHCKNLEQMYEVERPSHMTSKKMSESQALYTQGTGLCNTSQQKLGVKTLKAGLERIGVKTKSIVYSSTYNTH